MPRSATSGPTLPRTGFTSQPYKLLRFMLLLAGAGWLLCLLAIVAWSQRETTENADVIVVLGAAHYGGRPSPVLKARLDHAVRLWKDGRAPKMVLTGGRHPGDKESEAEAGRRYVMRRGVPESALLLELEGRTTFASIRSVSAILDAQLQTESQSKHKVLLVSDPFHMLRLELLARLYGLSPIPSPTRTSPISANRTVALEYVLRESIAVPTDMMLGAWLRVSPSDTVILNRDN